jgi:glucose/arabinose dehydrogenase
MLGRRLICFGTCAFTLACFRVTPSRGGGQIDESTPRRIDPSDVAVPAEYRVEVAARGLTFPTGVAFDDQNRAYVIEAGYSYGERFGLPRLLRIEASGPPAVVASGKNGPWTGIAFHAGAFYVAEGGVTEGGRIVRIDMNGSITPLVEGLPSFGDHHTNGPVVGPDGFVYFGQGTATNSAIVGEDNHAFGWLARHPEFHDIPCRDVTLSGFNFETKDVVKKGTAPVKTGAYLPFGTPSQPNQVIQGRVPCTGAVMRVPLQGGPPELVAWGLRNPFGLAFGPDGELYVTDNSYDDRGSRPVFGSGDVLWRLQRGAWHGWPDFAEGRPLYEDEDFERPGGPRPTQLLASPPNQPPQPVAIFPVHSSADGIDFSTQAGFGHVGEAFVALFGDQAPAVGKTVNPVGFKVVRVNLQTGVSYDFAVNPGGQNGPASLIGNGGLERPLAVRFDRAGLALYVVDFGVLAMEGSSSLPQERTGVLWRITRAGAR